MLKLNITLDIGKILPLEKLIDVTEKGIGRTTKAHYDKKDIDTKAYEIIKLKEAKAQALVLSNQIINHAEKQEVEKQLSNPSLEERTQHRVSFQEQKKQKNIESIIGVAAKSLETEESVTNEGLDADWITRFFRDAENISNETMQSLWGKILAGEIKQPKTFSLRTLEIVRNLTVVEANTFVNAAHFVAHSHSANACCIMIDTAPNLFNGSYNISFAEITLLMDIGLIHPQSLSIKFDLGKFTYNNSFVLGEFILVAHLKEGASISAMPIQKNIYSLTQSGTELLTLTHSEPPFEYLAAIAKSIENEFVSVKYGRITNRDGSHFEHTGLQDFE